MAAKKAKEGDIRMLKTADVAKHLKVKPAYLRRVLRETQGHEKGTYNRHSWKEGDSFLTKLPGILEKYEAAKKEKKEKSAAKKEKKAPKKAAAKKGKKTEPAADSGDIT